ncbi:hypothetical protein FH972_013114 [Carpinus fangiana]|uniref:Tetraspanin n=1 Tax=Carpinus fangiana TaxID=176857 RepID=A0A5N6R7C7_9ROSI|nr:hypothetical protein FH972_013114 [Carpinus fangiana]
MMEVMVWSTHHWGPRERTQRKDPLDGFKKYTRGWNISDHHYWASVGFTAVPLFVIAAVWFLAFGLCLCLISICYFCVKREPYGYSKTAYALSLIFLIIFTIAAIVGCVVLYTGQERFHGSTTNTLERLALIIVAAIMLLLTFLGCLFSVFGMQSLVYILVIAGWILVTGTFILCGIFLLLHNSKLGIFIKKETDGLADKDCPQSHDIMGKKLCCSAVFFDLINQVITNVSNLNFAPGFKQMYINQSGPLVPILCNPYYLDFTDRPCTSGEVNLINASEIWSSYVCQVSAAGICSTTGRLTPTFYNQMVTGVNMGFALYNYAPFLVDLQNCAFVRETFGEIYRDHCPGLRRYSRWIYVGLVMVSTSVMLSLIFWVIYGRERRHRVYTKEKEAMSKSSEALEGSKDH